MSLNSIDLAKLRNGEFSQFLVDVLSIVQQNDPTVLKVVSQHQNLTVSSQDIEKLFKVPSGSVLSDELLALDARRDEAITGLNAIITGFTYSTDPGAKQAALLLQNHLSSFGANIARDSYQSETSSIRNILDDWQAKPPLTAALTTLNLGNWRDELASANTSFGEQYVARAVETGTASPDTIKAKRIEANNAYYKLRDRLNSHFDINDGAEPWATTVASINGLVDYYNSTLSRRGTTETTTPVAPVV